MDQAISRIQSWQIPGSSGMAYRYFRQRPQKVLWAKTVWALSISSKYSFMLWFSLTGRLLSRDRLDFLVSDRGCGLCSWDMETVGTYEKQRRNGVLI